MGGGGTHIKPPVQNVTDTAIRKISGIYHDTLANADVKWSADFGWDYFVNSKDYSSTKYNRELAKVSLALCASLEDSFDSTKEILEGSGGRGLECTVGKTKFEELSPAIAIANKSIVYPDGTFTRIFIIVLRGTTTNSDIWNDAGSGLFWNNWGADDIEEYISGCISGYGVTTENTKFLVTGHSLGGACANLVARDLSEAFGTENVFAYTFATPSPYQHKVSGNYDNIYTFLCCQDNVPLCLVGRSNWYGYGRRVWFNYYEQDNPLKERYFDLAGKDWKKTYDDNFLFRLHAPTAYFAYLMEIPKPFDKSNIFYGAKIECPVDVWIYDSGGNLVGHIQNDKVDFGSSTDSVMLAVEGSAKYIYFTRDDAYTFKIVGTDIGMMTYTAFSVDMNTDDVKEEKVYSNVKIEKNKIFTSIVGSNSGAGEDDEGGSDISGVQLFVLNDKGKTEKEVLPDGNGTEVAVGKKPEKPEEPGTVDKTEHPVSKKPKEDDFSVKVKEIKISGISHKIAAGRKITLKSAVSPSNVSNKSVTWKSGNTKYAAVDSRGVVTLKKAGKGKTVTITAIAEDGSGKKASYKIKIMKGIVKKIKIDGKTSLTAKAGTSIKLKTIVKASNGANKALQWKSSNIKYVSVNSKGKVALKKTGKGKTVRITASATDGSGKKATVKIKIK